jgi:hypothetical protein
VRPKIADIGAIGRANKKKLLALGNANFPLKVLALSPWILLPVYTEMSRYPLKECSYINNLQLFRRYEAQLRPYFAYLIGVFKELQNDADVATLRA